MNTQKNSGLKQELGGLFRLSEAGLKLTQYILETNGSPACRKAEKILEANGIAFRRAWRVDDPYEPGGYPALEIRAPGNFQLLPNLICIKGYFKLNEEGEEYGK